MLGQEILVNKTDPGCQVMIVDRSVPESLCGLEWIKQYLVNFGVEMEEMTSTECNQIFNLVYKE